MVCMISSQQSSEKCNAHGELFLSSSKSQRSGTTREQRAEFMIPADAKKYSSFLNSTTRSS